MHHSTSAMTMVAGHVSLAKPDRLLLLAGTVASLVRRYLALPLPLLLISAAPVSAEPNDGEISGQIGNNSLTVGRRVASA
jgi:hypothetical protein